MIIMEQENKNTKTKNETGDNSMTVPRGLHKPPAGYIAIANQYLWSDDDNDDQIWNVHSEKMHEYSKKCEKGQKRNIRFSSIQDIPYSFLPPMVHSTPPLNDDKSLQQNETESDGENMTLSNHILRLPSRCKIIVLFLENHLVRITIYLRNQSHPRILLFVLIITLLFGSVFDYLFESSRSSMRANEIIRRIINENVSSSEKITMQGSPQADALQWITNYDPLQVDPSDVNIITRYALAVFYFSMTTIEDMTPWDNNTWLTGMSVCQWEGILCAKSPQVATSDQVIGLNLMHIQGQLPGKELTALVSLIS